MATNVRYDRRSNVRVQLTVGASKSANDVIFLNDMPVFLLEDSDSDNKAVVVLLGVGLVVDLSVVGQDGSGSSAVAVGDKIFVDGTAYNKDSINGTWIGYALETVTSGSTTTIKVALLGGVAEAGLVNDLTATAAEINTVCDGATVSAAEINVLDGVTAGTVTASKGLVVDANKALDFLALGAVAPSAAALAFGIGASSTRLTTATADKNAVEFRTESTAVSGDFRGIYNRAYLGGAGGSGESLRTFTTVDDVAAANAHGIHASLNFNATGSVTGQGIASRNTLHIPDDASWAPGTIAALQAEIWSDGDASDTDGATEVSFIRVVNGGNANGIADVDDDADLLALSGFTIGAGNMVQTETDETKFSHKIRCNVGGTTLYLMACAT